jgi:hypothetical protein
MALVPYGKVDFGAEALKLYGSHERFPGYQDAQMFGAVDYIMDGFDENSKYSEADWQAISERLADQVQNGLT